MAAALVCTGNKQARFACDSTCEHCGLLMPDRRRQAASYLRNAAERRYLNDWVPYSLRLAGAGAGGETVTAAPRRSTAATPLLMAAALVIFNVMDSLLTARALSQGVVEVNPLMAGLFNFSLPLGMLLKTLLVAAGVLVLWGYWHLPLARRGMMALTGFYGAVVVYHLVFQLNLLHP